MDGSPFLTVEHRHTLYVTIPNPNPTNDLKTFTHPIVENLKNAFEKKLRDDGDLEERDSLRSVNVRCTPLPPNSTFTTFSKHIYILTK